MHEVHPVRPVPGHRGHSACESQAAPHGGAAGRSASECAAATLKPENCVRLRLAIRGAVQGVGFRPFVYRLASELALNGWVNNSTEGVFVEAEAPRARLEEFLLRIEKEKPPRSFIQSLEPVWLDPAGYHNFEIRPSEPAGRKTAFVLPDIATCADCRREIFDPNNRRYRYPFTNCTHCGPRFSIIESLPYDRANTSMRLFAMCPACRAEYEDPRDRRFHAQPNACPVCGPHLELWTTEGEALQRGYQALLAAAEALRRGQIVALKGLGGFHLMVDARNDSAVGRLRERKRREEKPFALMFPSLPSVNTFCEVSPLEQRLLLSPESPIVLLRRSRHPQPAPRGSRVAPQVCPGNPCLGAMLPYTPLHHLLLAELGFPIVATSGNLSDEPICTDEREAIVRLRGMAEAFLVHNRPIVRHVDDSIVRVMLDREMVLRRARGYAPLPLPVRTAESSRRNILAVGAHYKNSVALAVGGQVFLSQHIGDLETEQAFAAFRRVIADFQRLYDVQPQCIAADLHPDYLSTQFARDLSQAGIPPVPATTPQPGTSQALSTGLSKVQHHVAHVLSCMAENDLDPPLLGVSWDGTGYGTDGTIWGGEFLIITNDTVERIGHLRCFRLPGGDIAAREPRRAALGLLYEMLGQAAFERLDLAPLAAFAGPDLSLLAGMLTRGLNSPLCSSIGRLFDAVASLINLRQRIRFEGQAAMELEFALDGHDTNEHYDLPLVGGPGPGLPIPTTGSRSTLDPGSSPVLLDWAPMVQAILSDLRRGESAGIISAKFHNALAEAIIAIARQSGQERVALSGGCFQNRYLTERAVRALSRQGFRPCWHQRIPPNDGGVALGQIVATLRHYQS